MAAERVVPNAFRARSLNGSVTPMVGAGRDRPERVASGMAVEMEPPGMGPQEMATVSRFAVRQAAPGMRFVQAVGASVPTGIAPPAVLPPGIGCTEPAATQSGPSLAIGPSSAIGLSSGIAPDLSAGLRTLARRSADPLTAVPLTGDPLTGDPLIAVRAAVPPVVLPGALAPRVLGLAALMAAEIVQAPGR